MNKQMMNMDFAAAERRVMGYLAATKEINGVPMMSHVQISELTGKRQDWIKVVMDDLKKEGVISFTEILENPEGGLGGRPIKVYYVTERDSHVVVGKISSAYLGFLVDFWMTNRKPAAPQFQIPQTFAEALKLAADLALEKERDAPKVAFVDEVVNQSEGLMTLGNYGRVLKDKRGYDTGAKKIFKQLRTLGLIMEGRSIPYDRYVNQGLFVVSEKITEFRADPVTYVTAKGQIYVHQKLNQLLG